MAEKEAWVGSEGPFIFDNAEYYDDDEVPPKNYRSFRGSQILLEDAPSSDEEVIRKVDLLDLIRPIGSYYFSSDPTDPGTLFGGTWVAVEGKFIATYKSGDADFGTVGATGGAKTAAHDHNHDGTAVNSHSGTAVANHADHIHTGPPAHSESANVQGAAAGDVVTDGTHGDTGGSTTTLSHSVTQPVDHTVTQPTAHSDHSILPPFEVCYAWKRTA